MPRVYKLTSHILQIFSRIFLRKDVLRHKTNRNIIVTLRSAENDYWVARIGATRRESFRSPHEQLLRLDHVSLHPDYVGNGVFVNDIAVLRLERPVTFSDYVRPVCLPANSVTTGATCIITGFGQLFETNRVFRE